MQYRKANRQVQSATFHRVTIGGCVLCLCSILCNHMSESSSLVARAMLCRRLRLCHPLTSQCALSLRNVRDPVQSGVLTSIIAFCLNWLPALQLLQPGLNGV